jgi:anthranilate synthase component I
MNLKSETCSFFVDTTTPVGMYLQVRDKFRNCALFEGADFSALADSHSFICCEPIAEYRIDGRVLTKIIGQSSSSETLQGPNAFATSIQDFITELGVNTRDQRSTGAVNGLFGYFSWKAIELMEDIQFSRSHAQPSEVSAARFYLYRFVITFDALKNSVKILRNSFVGEEGSGIDIESFARIAFGSRSSTTHFHCDGEEASNLTDEAFLDTIANCKKHIQRGDVFQIVPSRQYRQNFSGDDFTVYRTLRSINPSPYLFYMDMGEYRIFGSSPEAQVIVRDGIVTTCPIAGTYRRTGDLAADTEAAKRLQEDEKENAEHAMLVDLARNDLSRVCKEVYVREFRTLRYFSHVIHLVSEVVGHVRDGVSGIQVATSTFPAGTLSGAPKHKALQLLDAYEPQERGIYGGAVGFFSFSGDVILAIMIRSFLSKHSTLYYQVGMGTVFDSVPESEVNECHAKIGALRAAIHQAEKL